MKEKAGEVFSICEDNRPVPLCTVSREIWSAGDAYICYFSLARDTDISAESYGDHKLILVSGGGMEIYAPARAAVWKLAEGEALLTPTQTPVGMRTNEGTVYLEISVGEGNAMNNAIKTGEVFRLADLVPYQEGRIVNMDITHNDRMKFVVMAFDEGTGLSEHAAPGEALVLALDGQGVIGYEGESHPIRAGESFKFAKDGKHWVKADGRFKMALLLTLE